MTEREWLTFTDASNMLEHLKGKSSDRKVRLFAVAAARLPYLGSSAASAVDVLERYADDLSSPDELAAAVTAARQALAAFDQLLREEGIREASGPRLWAAMAALAGATVALQKSGPELADRFAWAARQQPTWEECGKGASEYQCALLRDIFGNPFGPVPLGPSCRSRRAVKLAGAVYRWRCFGRLAVLGDALEEVGCTDQDILEHCRGGGDHVRGCWVVDAVLGKN